MGSVGHRTPLGDVSYHSSPSTPTCLSPAPARTVPGGVAEKSPRQVWTARPLGKWYRPPLPPAQAYPLPASLISQPAEPDLEKTSQFNQEHHQPASGWLLRKRSPAPRQTGSCPVQLPLARTVPAFEAREGRGEETPSRQDGGAPSTVSTQPSDTSVHAGGGCGSQQESEEAGMRRGTAPSSPAPEGPGSMDAGAGFGVTGLLFARQQNVSGAAHGGRRSPRRPASSSAGKLESPLQTHAGCLRLPAAA